MAEACMGCEAPGLCPGPRDIYEQMNGVVRQVAGGCAAMIRGARHG